MTGTTTTGAASSSTSAPARRQPGRKVVGALLLIDVDQVKPNPANVRRRGGLGDLTELAASIRAEGILEPLLVEEAEGLGDGTVRIVAGHRRYAAAKTAGLREVPCIVRSAAPQQQLRRTKAQMLIENLHRRGLHPLDEADAYYALTQDGMTVPEIAHRTGISAKTIRERLALRDLPDQAQQMVRTGELRLGQANQLARQVRTTRRGTVTTGVPTPRAPQHFTATHPLGEAAHVACDLAGHPSAGRLGGACGACWETAIRDDERRRTRPGSPSQEPPR